MFLKKYKPIEFMGKWFWGYILGVIGEKAITAVCFNIVIAILMKDLFNAAREANKDLLIRAGVVAVGSLLIAVIFQPIFVYQSRKAQKRTMNRLRLITFNHMTELPMSYFEKEHSGSILSRLTNDIKIIEDIYNVHVPRIFFILFLGFGSLTLMFIYNWRLSLYAVIFEALSILLSVRLAKKIRKISDNVQVQRSRVNEKFLDIVAGFKTTKIFQIEDVIVNNYKQTIDNLTDVVKKRDNLSALINAVGQFFYSAKSIGLIVLGIYMVLKNRTDIGTFIAIVNLQNNIGLLSSIGETIGELQGSMAGVGRVVSLIDEEVESHEAHYPLQEQITDSMVELRDVVFGYDNKTVLDKLSISAKKGESIALVGKSGCGKSTIAKLLLGFYHSKAGDILIAGKSISSYTLEELREKIAYVPQIPNLFAGTIKDNIRCGRLNATEEEIINAAKIANAHDFILKQEEGYDTLIGEGGENLSGGEKQRLAIARAINKGSSIILFDEATSALDSESEEKVQQAIERIMQEKTVLIIAHRLATIKQVDKIYVLDEGKVLSVQTNH